jgi:PAS domain S-box-containing protein
MGIFTYYDMVTRTEFYSDRQEERALEISNTVIRSIERPMLEGEMTDVQAILERLNTLKDVTVLNLCDAAGIVRHSGFPVNIGRVDNSEITGKALRTGSLVNGLEVREGERILHHAMPILNEKSCHRCHDVEKRILGALAVGISWTATEERITALRNRQIALTIISLMAVCFFLTLFLSNEEERRWSEEKYSLLFDTEPHPVFILDRGTLRILDANARAESQYGSSKKELLGKSFRDLGYDEDTEKIISSFKSIVNSRSVLSAGKRPRKKDGGLLYATIHVCGARYMGKDALIAITADVTENVRKDIQLARSSKMATLGEMATGVAHELNQPLNTIQIGTDFFRNMVRQGQEIPPDELTLVSEQMAEQVARAVRIINHLRDFGRRTEIHVEEIDINQPIKGVFTLLREQLRLRGIKLALDLQEGLPRIVADSNRLEQVFMNLVINARQAMKEKDQQFPDVTPDNTLTVRSFQENGHVVVTVTDTGMGIPDDICAKMFEPFFTTKEAANGTGLGLSISHGIVKDYNGMIKVESVAGKGSTFKITFPASGKEGSGG